MLVIMEIMPLRYLLGFAFESRNWGPPQSISFGVADYLYRVASGIASICIGLSAGIMVTFLNINTKKWWAIFGCLYIAFIIITLVILHRESVGWDSLYGHYYLDVLISPLVLLAEIEIIAYVRRHKGITQA